MINTIITDWKSKHVIPPAVVIESPYAGKTALERGWNAAYLDLIIREVALGGGTPYASHRMLPGPLDDNDPSERALGISLGRGMIIHLWPCIVLFCVDRGWSRGMIETMDWMDSSPRMEGEWFEVRGLS
jgi:hypothetical protein